MKSISQFCRNGLQFTREEISSTYAKLTATDQSLRDGARYYKNNETGEGHWCMGLDDVMYYFGGVPDYQI